jgi:DNA-binding transcriptional LysR family regulator
MELRDLAYFLTLVDEGHLTRAAARLHVAQPTLSHALARLEGAVGEALLVRPRNRRLALRATPAGRLLAARARRALAEVDGLRDDLDALRGLLRGELRLVSIQSLNATCLPRPLARFAAAHPGVAITLRTLSAEDVPDALRHGHADLGIAAGVPAVALAGLQARTLLREEFVAIVRRDHALAARASVPLAALAGEPMVLVPPATYTGSVIHAACRKAGFAPRAVLALESGEALRETVRAGLGLTILPAGYLGAHERELRAVRLTAPTPVRDVVALTPADRTPPRAVTAFTAELVSTVGGR